MIPLRARFWFVYIVLLLLSLGFASEEPVVFDALHKPLKPFAGLEYSEIPLTGTESSVEKLNAAQTHKIEAQFSTGRQLVGKVDLALDASISSPEAIQATVILIENDNESIVAQGNFAADGKLELQFEGHFAERVRIETSGANAENPIENFTIQSIILGSETRIMLIGDSITEAHYDTSGSVREGYRHLLYRQLDQAYSNIDFVGTSGDEPYEAHCDGGKRISAFNKNGSMDVRGPMNSYHPQIVAIHLGTNDVNNYQDPQQSAEQMRSLINYLLDWRYNDNGALLDENIRLDHILVSLIIPAKYRDELCIETNRQFALVIDDFISGRETGQPEPIHVVDHFSRFREWPPAGSNGFYNLMWDRLHPDNSGHYVMASTYFDIFDDILSGQSDNHWFSDISFLANIIGTDYHYNDDNTTDFYNHAIAVADINDDGMDDFYTTRSDYGDKSAHDNMYIWNGDLPYSDKTSLLGLDDPGGSRGAVFVDIDNDGDFDLFNGNSPGRNRLYENRNGVDFTERTNVGIADINATTTGVAAFDADNDGDMDLLAFSKSATLRAFARLETGVVRTFLPFTLIVPERNCS